MSEQDYGLQPPSDVDAERAVLGAMLSSGRAINEVVGVIGAKDFYRPAHQVIFDSIVHVSGDGDVDPVVVGSELSKRGKLLNVGGAAYLFELIQACPSAINAVTYARAVVRKARMRHIVETGIRWQQLGYADTSTDEELDLVVSQAEEFLRGLQSPTESDGTMFGDLTTDWLSWQQNPADIIPGPWVELNDYLAGGFRKGKLYVIAGRPGSGKSMGGLNIAQFMAEHGTKATIFSLEMAKLEVAGRLLAAGGWVSYNEVFRKQMSKDTRDAVLEYIETWRELDLEVVDKAGITVEQIVAHIRNRKPAAVFIDYCQLITASFKGDRREAIDHITRSLKVCAADTNTCIILASQVNRNGAERMPTIADLRESGSIENDADVVLLLHREDEGSGTVKMNVGKNRDGKMGTIEFVWRGDLARIG